MKNLKLYLALMLLFAWVLNGCLEDNCTRETKFIQYTPVYLTSQELQDVKVTSPRTLEKPGKIYFYKHLIFINEINEGIHIIDNSEPSNPINLSFIQIPANIDMAVYDKYLYADNGDDLLTFNISNLDNIELVDREEDVFPQLYEYDGQIMAYYETEEVMEEVDCASNGGFIERGGGIFLASANVDMASVPGSAESGVGGSMARFTISQGHLYVVDDWQLNVFNVANDAASPEKINDVNVGWGIETIFPYGDKLFIGSSAGMFIFENSDPTAPYQLSNFEHARACDPVYVKDNYAYVTLRSGTWCEGYTDQLDLIDISDLEKPSLEKTFKMDNPHGLSIKENDLYLCEGDFGLKVFDISDPMKLDKKKRSHLEDFHAYDVISVPGTDVLLVIGDDGFYQFDASDPKNLVQISKIEVAP
jgi:hypothetical protein